MATKVTNTTSHNNNTTGDFRAWCTFVKDLLFVTGGWVQTGDTGQIDLSTVAAPGSANQKMGYVIARMNDALQATSPVFIRFDFGAGGNFAYPGIWITIGTGSDGAGNITNKRFDGGGLTAATISGNGNTTISQCNGSAASNRVHFALHWRRVSDNGVNLIFFCSIERSKNPDGTDSGDGILFWWSPTQSYIISAGRYVYLLGTPQPAAEQGVAYILSGVNPSAYQGDVGFGLGILFKGVAQQPGTGIAIVNSADFSVDATPVFNVYGTNITYQMLSTYSFQDNTANIYSLRRLCMRFD